MKHITTVVALIALLGGAAQAKANDDRAAMAEEQMRQTFERLELTDEQIEQVEPILLESAAARQEILSKYGMDPESRQGSEGRPAMREMRAMRKEMQAVQKSVLDELEPILSEEQFEEFKLIQDDRRAEMRERIRRPQ